MKAPPSLSLKSSRFILFRSLLTPHELNAADPNLDLMDPQMTLLDPYEHILTGHWLVEHI